MSILHAYFNLRRQTDFQRCLEQSKASLSDSTGPQLSSSSGSGPGSRSWTKFSSSTTPIVDVNSRDWLGRTVLHLACSAVDPAALEYTRLLLGHPQINVNLQDQESLWSPLHRALYSGNIAAVVLLLQRSDTDMFIKDVEGYTPFDLYNSTVAGTNPAEVLAGGSNAELYTWGSNRNAGLGLKDGDDRVQPAQVVIRPSADSVNPEARGLNNILGALKLLSVIDVAMSKLHTTIITGEAKGNLRSCGFSSTGRLGSGGTNASHTQFSFINPQETLPHKIIMVALGQDHTLAVTSSGEVLSWGLNRFHQLGYAFEGKSNAQEDQIQSAARKITGPLRNQIVIGVACCKTASVCWTATQLFSWGTNHGQLGYEKIGQPQIIPRLVSCVSEPVIGAAMTDSALLVLLKNRDVICLHEGKYWKVQFPVQRSLRAYRPPAKEKTEIRKITACEGSVGNFALVSEAGDVYLFNTEEASVQRKDVAKDAGPRRPVPHLVWAVRRQFTAVKDVALGSDGSMVLCTRSGHVFVRSRVLRAGLGLGSNSLVNPSKNAPIFKFHRIPNLQRISKVCANNTDAFAALRVDAVLEPIKFDGHTVADDLDAIQPFRSWEKWLSSQSPDSTIRVDEAAEELDPMTASMREDDDAVDLDIVPDIRAAMELCNFITLTSHISQPGGSHRKLKPLSTHQGADLFFQIHGCFIPVHSAVLLARAPALREVVSGKSMKCTSSSADQRAITLDGMTRLGNDRIIKVRGCSPMTILILCYYLYTDSVVTIWDRRVSLAISDRYGPLNVDGLSVRSELRLLALTLQLRILEAATGFVGKAPITPTLIADLKQVLSSGNIPQDVVLHLADATVKSHSFVLRSRSPYFATFFDKECWTEKRFSAGTLEINLKEFKSLPMSYLLRYLYGDVTPDLFGDLDSIHSSDQFIDFMFEIVACSNHFLLDRLTDLCSSQILRLVDLRNVSATLIDASHLNATSLVKCLHGYMTENLETLMEMHALDDLPQDVLKTFSKFLHGRQTAFHPYVRGGANILALELYWAEWLHLQDFPVHFIPKYHTSHQKHAPVPTPQTMSLQDPKNTEPASPSALRQRAIAKSSQAPAGDEDIFPMDGDVPTSKSTAPATAFPSSQASSTDLPRVWKSAASSDRVDMRAIMEAEQQAVAAKHQAFATGSSSYNQPSRKWTPKLTMEAASKPGDQVWAGVGNGSPPSRKSTINAPSANASSPLRPSPLSTQKKWSQEGTVSPSRALLASRQITVTSPSSPLDVRSSSSASLVTPGNSKKGGAPKDKAPVSPESHLGPLIVPVKTQATPASSVRRSGSGEGAVWSNKRPTLPTSQVSSQVLSFAAIQAQQATKASVSGPPKSLREIQDEEQEVAFLTWFESESARIKKQEEEALSSAPSPGEQSRKPNQSRRGKGGRERGRGRGRGQGRTIPEVST